MSLEIITNPNPILRQKAKKIKDPIDPALLSLVEAMKKTLESSKSGIGLAAPQVGQSIRLCVVERDGAYEALINPKIISRSKKNSLFEEGCLSFPGLFYAIERPEKVKVRYLNEKGEKVTIKAEGILARLLQHEVDHLDGKLFIDYLKK